MSSGRWALACLFAVLLLPIPQASAQFNNGPAIASVDPPSGEYWRNPGGQFPVSVDCTKDPAGDDVFVEFWRNGSVVAVVPESDSAPASYSFDVTAAGTYTLKAHCIDENTSSANPNNYQWTVFVSSGSTPSSSSTTSSTSSTTTTSAQTSSHSSTTTASATSSSSTSPSSAPTRNPTNSAPQFSHVQPEPGLYEGIAPAYLEISIGCFDPEYGETFVVFEANGATIKTTQASEIHPANATFQFEQAGEFRIDAYCRDDQGMRSDESSWLIEIGPGTGSDVPQKSDLGTPSCSSQDPLPGVATTPELTRLVVVIQAHPGFWHRTDEWTCSLAELQKPMELALAIDESMLALRERLRGIAVFDWNAWDEIVAREPTIASVWLALELLHPVLETCLSALSNIDEFVAVRLATLNFLSNPSEPELLRLRATIASSTQVYVDVLKTIDSAANEFESALVQQLDPLVQKILEVRAIAESFSVPFVVEILDGFLAHLARIEGLIRTLGAPIRAIAQPFEADLLAMSLVMRESTPSNPVTDGNRPRHNLETETVSIGPGLVFLCLALAFASATRKR